MNVIRPPIPSLLSSVEQRLLPMHFSVSHALVIAGTALIAVLSSTALHAQDGTPAPMDLVYRSAFDSAVEPPADEVRGTRDGMEMMVPSDTATGPAALAAPDGSAPERGISAERIGTEAPGASVAPALEFGSAFDDYDRYEEVGDPDWVAANDNAAAAGGWQAYATDLYRANKARTEAAKALDADPQSDNSAGDGQ